MEADTSMATPLQQLVEIGQSPWYDNIRRGFIASGALQDLIDGGIRGVTANPTIFEKAILGSADYDDAIRDLLARGARSVDIYETLLIADIGAAADMLRPIYDRTNGQDGFVSIEVSPKLAHDTAASIAEARRFWSALNRPNLMVKAPPAATIEAFQDHGRVARTIDQDLDDAYDTIRRLEAVGISITAATDTLLVDGVTIFTDSFAHLDAAIQEKRAALLARC